MSVYRMLEDVAKEQGWSESTQLQVVLEYISNQQDDLAFKDFLGQTVAFDEFMESVRELEE